MTFKGYTASSALWGQLLWQLQIRAPSRRCGKGQARTQPTNSDTASWWTRGWGGSLNSTAAAALFVNSFEEAKQIIALLGDVLRRAAGFL